METEEPQIVVLHGTGRTANRMFQLMLATELQRRAGVGRIVGHALPRWGIVGPAPEPLRAPRLLLLEHVFDLNQTAELMRKGVLPSVVIAGWGMRLSYYRPPDAYRTLFPVLGQGYRAGEDELVIHVRGDDILDLHHPRYCPLPFSFYERVIEVSGLRPLFMGQIGDDAYSAALRSRFPGAAILPRQSVVDDFDTIRTARHVVLSASSFAWLAAWLSETVRTIHLPVFHLLDPRDGQTFLLPLEDPRYRFYAIQELVADETGAVDLVAWATQARSAGPLDREQLAGLAGFREPAPLWLTFMDPLATTAVLAPSDTPTWRAPV